MADEEIEDMGAGRFAVQRFYDTYYSFMDARRLKRMRRRHRRKYPAIR